MKGCRVGRNSKTQGYLMERCLEKEHGRTAPDQTLQGLGGCVEPCCIAVVPS